MNREKGKEERNETKIGKDRQTHPSFLRRPLKIISTSSIFIIIVSKFARCPLGPGVTLNALSDYAASLLHFLSKFCNTQCSLCNAFSVQGLKKIILFFKYQSSVLKIHGKSEMIVNSEGALRAMRPYYLCIYGSDSPGRECWPKCGPFF